MIAYFLVLVTGLTWLLTGVIAPDSARSGPAHPKVSVYEIISPVPNQVVVDRVDIIGSVNSPELFSYFVEFYRALDVGGKWVPATLPRLEPVIGDRLGTFNTTLLPDGKYDMRLVVLTGGDTKSTLAFGPIVVRNSPMAAATKAAEIARAEARKATADYCEPPACADKMDRASEVSVSIDAPLPGQILSGDVHITGSVEAPDMKSFFVEFSLLAGRNLGDWYPATLPRVESIRSGVIGTWNTRVLKDGQYHLRLTVNAGDGPAQRFLIGTFEVRHNS